MSFCIEFILIVAVIILMFFDENIAAWEQNLKRRIKNAAQRRIHGHMER